MIGPGPAAVSLTKQQLANGGKEKWDSITDQMKTRWTLHGMSRWDGAQLLDKLWLPGKQRRVIGGAVSDDVLQTKLTLASKCHTIGLMLSCAVAQYHLKQPVNDEGYTTVAPPEELATKFDF